MSLCYSFIECQNLCEQIGIAFARGYTKYTQLSVFVRGSLTPAFVLRALDSQWSYMVGQ